MPFTIVDSDILIDFSRGDVIAADCLDKTESKSTLVISSITEMELMVGCRDKTTLREIRKFLFRFQIISINERMSSLASELIEEYSLSHGLGIPDALIAATALTLNENFVTGNQRDFRFIKGLKLLSYP